MSIEQMTVEDKALFDLLLDKITDYSAYIIWLNETKHIHLSLYQILQPSCQIDLIRQYIKYNEL